MKNTTVNSSEPVLSSYFPWLLGLGILLNIPGLGLDIMEPDGALYATLAKHIVIHNDWMNLFGDGHDWLDKPHFPFWMAALSYKIFGITSFAYKLPAFLFWLAGLGYTYLTARDLYNEPVARLSVILYLVAFHSSLGNFDVRAEPYLTTCIIAAVWHMIHAARNSFSHLIAAAFFAACAIMTKGIFVLATIGAGWVIFWIVTKQWSQFWHWRWWVFLVLCFGFILPELYALYVQFDLHPEKIVFGKTHVSGLQFFFWDSQFGRFFNTGPIKGTGNPGFFLHTTLWAFLPWSLALVGAVIFLVRFDKNKNPLRWVIYGSMLITFALFSFSKFQLPHYIVILFPYFSIISAYFLFENKEWRGLRIISAIQLLTVVAAGAAALGILYKTQLPNAIPAAVIVGVLVIIGTFVPRGNPFQLFVLRGYALAAIIYIFLFFFFYPFLLKFQSGREAARYIPSKDSQVPAAAFETFSYSFEFYAPGDVELLKSSHDLEVFLKRKPCYLYTSQAVAENLLHSGIKARVLAMPPYFRITLLKPVFLDYRTRSSVTEIRYLLYVY